MSTESRSAAEQPVNGQVPADTRGAGVTADGTAAVPMAGSTPVVAATPAVAARPRVAARPTVADTATAASETNGAPSTGWQPADAPAGDRPRQHQPDEAPAARRGPVPGWLRFFFSELRLVFGRPRNLALLGVLAAVPIFFGIVFRLAISAPTGPGGGPAFLNQLAGNGVFLALVVLTLLLLLLLPLAIAVISGDSIAGEAGLGTLRGLLAVPAGRTRLLSVKYAVIAVFCLAACLMITVISLIMGLILFHVGPVTLLSGTTVPLWAGIGRIMLVTVYVAIALTSAGAIGLAASTLTQHPVGAIAGLLVVIIGSEISDQVPQLSAIHSYLPTHYWLAWDGLFRAPIDWSGVAHGLLSFAVYGVIFVSIAWAKFTSADVSS